MKRNVIRMIVGLLLCLAAGQSSFGQIRPSEQVQMQFHRAQSAWRNQTSILEAKVRVDQVLREAPNYAEAWKLRAEVFLAMERYPDALRDARQATKLNPEYREAFLVLAEAARLNNELDMARQALQKASDLSLNASADFHIQLSNSAVLLGDSELNMAESFARVAMAKEPNNAQAYYQLARVFLLQEREDDAVTTLARGLQSELLDPAFIGYDSTLVVLRDHPALRDLLK